MSEITIESTVTKMKIGKTEKDEREESSGLSTQLSFEVVGSPRQLARMANLLKQGNTNISLIIRATNAATDLKVETINLPHQMGLGEVPVPPVRQKEDLTANAGLPPAAEDVLKAGNTPIRTGEPITEGVVSETTGLPETGDSYSDKASVFHDDLPELMENAEEAQRLEQEGAANAEFDAMPSASESGDNGNGHKPKFPVFDLEKVFKLKVLDNDKGYTATLDGCRVKKEELVPALLQVFSSKAVPANNADQLVDSLLEYPEGETRNMLINVLRSGKLPEAAAV